MRWPVIREPRAHKNPQVVELKRGHFNDPHVGPLNQIVDELSIQCPNKVPYFDPFDGGINSKLLFILRSPVLGAEQSGIVSRDNDDAAAATTFRVFDEVGIPRGQTTLWNMIPWYSKPPFKKYDIEFGVSCLTKILAQFSSLEAIVFAGRGVPLQGSKLVQTPVRKFCTLSPGAQSRLSNVQYIETIIGDLTRVWKNSSGRSALQSPLP